jgi:hypothetical protein
MWEAHAIKTICDFHMLRDTCQSYKTHVNLICGLYEISYKLICKKFCLLMGERLYFKWICLYFFSYLSKLYIYIYIWVENRMTKIQRSILKSENDNDNYWSRNLLFIGKRYLHSWGTTTTTTMVLISIVCDTWSCGNRDMCRHFKVGDVEVR